MINLPAPCELPLCHYVAKLDMEQLYVSSVAVATTVATTATATATVSAVTVLFTLFHSRY
jgi:hypothetical protein